jgi:hypothetical protein
MPGVYRKRAAHALYRWLYDGFSGENMATCQRRPGEMYLEIDLTGRGG